MGCSQSKIENEEAVARCKERKQHMKDAVAARNAFAAAHSAYAMALKNTGAALNEYGEGEVHEVRASQSAAQAPPLDNLPPPPPPLPADYSPAPPPPPLVRSASMPDLPLPKSDAKPSETIIEEEETEDADATARPPETPSPPPPADLPPPPPDSKGPHWDYFGMNLFNVDHTMDSMTLNPEIRPDSEEQRRYENFESVGKVDDTDVAPQTPENVIDEPPPPPLALPKLVKKQRQSGGGGHQHSVSAVESSKKNKSVAFSSSVASSSAAAEVAAAASSSNVSLYKILHDLDEHFLRAYESAREVSKMLEANRMHYHSNFADNRGHIDHSARVLRVITWNRSFRGMPNPDDEKDDFYNEEWETHATILDKLLAWEKKLYDEVKAGELMKIEYQRKVALLNKQKKRGSNPEAVEKTKAAVSHLHTRYIVDMQSLDSTVSEIFRLRDHQLYPKLVELVDGMAKMWKTMNDQHCSQLNLVSDLRGLDISTALKETSDAHRIQTAQLHQIVQEWDAQFQKLATHQKEYIEALNAWLKLNLIPIESSLKEKVSSPPMVQRPPIQNLLVAWNDLLGKLPVSLAKSAIGSFAAIIHSIVLLQQDETKQKMKCEETKREYNRKLRSFEDWHSKYLQKRTPTEEVDPEGTEGTNPKDLVAEKLYVVDTLKKKLEDETEEHQKLCRHAREKSLASLKTHLPELFRAMTDFSLRSSEMYKELKSISEDQEMAESPT